MLDDALSALAQMFSKPFRIILLKSAGLAIVLLAAAVVAVFRLLEWLSGAGMGWLEGAAGPLAHWPLRVLDWAVAVALGVGLSTGAVFLVPAATALAAGFFADEIAGRVERSHYPGERPGLPLPFGRAAVEGVKTALLSMAVYLCTLPFFLFAGTGAVLFFLATAWLLGREYFDLAAMRFHPGAQAKALRRANRGAVFTAGLIIAAFVSVPFLNLATPLFSTALMVHVHKRLTGRAAA